MRNKLNVYSPYVIMLLPLLVIYSVFYIVPLIYTAIYSFTDWSNYSSAIQFTGLSNYRKILEDNTLFVGVKNSLVYAISTVILQNLIALPVAVLLNSKLKFRNGFRAIFFSPAVLSTLVVGFLWSYMLSSSDYGMLNKLLASFGIGPVNFLGDPDTALTAIILTQVWQWFGWAMVIYLANLQSISEDLYEAASIDGAGRLQQFFSITVPQLAPAIKINLITGMISGLKVFDIVVSLTKGGPGYSTETILTLMFSKFSEGNYGYAASFGIVFLMLSLALAALLLRTFKIWEDRLN
ncbi:carbohydrate ABC transporter permease [Paenibacillus vietnamensis]|uniref:carbohydrate ABC transporter permease n=1 Tax=Paenibacillus vietnamensis TaxID=2590547 RepID=UPI001CD14CFC|nr:sugar ABC transporter permease [Paenibacillus vietnamensis]